MAFFSSKLISMTAFLSVLLMTLVSAADTQEPQTQQSNLKATVDKAYFMKFNGILWVTFIMLYLALSAAWKISSDNTPDTQKDSILYAKFLTQNFQQKANWAQWAYQVPAWGSKSSDIEVVLLICSLLAV